MSVWANIGGTWRKGVLWQNVSGTWRKGTLWANVGGVWKKDPASGGGTAGLSAVADPNYVYGAVSRRFASKIGTNQTTVTPSNGIGPYTYSWSSIAGWTVTAPSSATTNFSAVVSPGDDLLVTFVCTVTDSAGSVVTTEVEAELSNYYSGGE